MRKIVGIITTVAALAALLAPVNVSGGSCGASFVQESQDIVRITGHAEMSELSDAWILDGEGRLLQVIPFRVDPFVPQAGEAGLLVLLSGYFSTRPDFEVTPGAAYRMLVVDPRGQTTCTAWFTAPSEPGACSGQLVLLPTGEWFVAGTTRVPDALWALVQDDQGRVVQTLPVLYDPLRREASLEAPAGRFSARAEFDVLASQYFDVVIVDPAGRTLCVDRLERTGPQLPYSTAAAVAYRRGGVAP